jgi:pimeloyl-ACP methyl ester carboxylesterase
MNIARTKRGVQVAFSASGNGRLGVIFQHGWASVGAHYDELRAHLPEEGRTFVALDLVGHGESPDVPEAHSVESYAEQLLAVADAVGLRRFVTVGHSMGGKFCQYLRILAPQRLIGQVALAPTPASATPQESSDEVIEQYSSAAGNPELFDQVVSQIIKKPPTPAVKAKWIKNASKISKSVLASSMRAYSRADFAARLPRVGPPTLVIAGEKDPIYPADSVLEHMKQEMPDAVFRSLDCGHDLPNEMPREVALLIDGFLISLASIAAS